MNAERLLVHYEKIADAPDAIARLRRFILDLAVRGKLVPQELGEEAAKGFRKPDDLAAPFELPNNWKWIEIGDQLDLLNGMAFKPTDWAKEGIRIVRIQNLNNPDAPFNFCNPEMARERSLIDSGSFLISWSGTPGTSFGAFIWDRGPAVLNQHIFRCDFRTKAFIAAFLRLAINGRLDEMIAKAHGGVGLQHITKGKLEALLIPLPPLAEQRRIVAKVDELMGFCDRLEAARVGREAVRDRLAAASLARLNAADLETFQADARFALRALPALTTRPDQIKALRQTILNLAVRGKLVPQDEGEEPAEELLKRIAKGKVRSRHGAVSIKPEDEPFALPATWKWAALDQLIVWGPQNGISPKPTKRDGAPKAITLTATTSGAFNPNYFKHVEANIPADSDFWLEDGDLLFQRGNTREYVGMAAVYRGPSNTFLFPDLIMKVRLSEHVCLEFAHLASISPPARDFLSANASGAQATMPKINQTTLVSLPIPLPPLAEQHRIVAKVDALMALCGRLEASLTATAATRRRLLDALLVEALAPTDASLSDVSDRQTVASVNGDPEKVFFAERSAYILSLAYERHRFARRERTFGHVKAQKILHLVEAEAGFDLGRAPIRDAAGPNDFKHMLAVEQWAREHERFVFETNGAGYLLRQLSDFDKSLTTEHGPDPSARAIATRLIDILVPMDTRQAEIFATVYSAWNNLLIEGKAPTDTEIVCAARDDWHPDKIKLPASDFFAALVKLRLKGIVPKGTGKFVHGPLQKDLFN